MTRSGGESSESGEMGEGLDLVDSRVESARQWWLEGEIRQRRGQFAKWMTGNSAGTRESRSDDGIESSVEFRAEGEG